MRNLTRFALAFLAIAGASTGVAVAEEGGPGWRHGQGAMMRFDRADADSSGDVTFEEFAAVIMKRIGSADADRDGKMTVAEIADEIQRMRAERMAERIVQRFDNDGDGMLTVAEIENRQRKMFALLDRNDDGKITREEMPKGGKRWHRQQP